jgi:beta-lactam-binding protein with PASTA domain
VAQYPSRGTLSAHDRVTLVVAKALHGRVPRVVGLPLERARARLRARGLELVVARFDEGAPGGVVAQTPAPGVAAGPGIRVRLVVGRPRQASG